MLELVGIHPGWLLWRNLVGMMLLGQMQPAEG